MAKRQEEADYAFNEMVNSLNGLPGGGQTGDAISDELDTHPILYERPIVSKLPDNGLEANSLIDYITTRNNLQQLISDGNSAIEGLLKVTTQSESPRAYEVLAGYLKTVAELNKQLMDLHQGMAEIETEQAKAVTGGAAITNNNVFVGSTEELQRYLEARKA